MQYADKVNCKSEVFQRVFCLFRVFFFADADVVHDEV